MYMYVYVYVYVCVCVCVYVYVYVYLYEYICMHEAFDVKLCTVISEKMQVTVDL